MLHLAICTLSYTYMMDWDCSRSTEVGSRIMYASVYDDSSAHTPAVSMTYDPFVPFEWNTLNITRNIPNAQYYLHNVDDVVEFEGSACPHRSNMNVDDIVHFRVNSSAVTSLKMALLYSTGFMAVARSEHIIQATVTQSPPPSQPPSPPSFSKLSAFVNDRVVFFGDSITQTWQGSFLRRHDYINKGISGETTASMLLRFETDVLDLQPDAVVILAGINDFYGNDIMDGFRYYRPSYEVFENIKEMTEMAQSRSIKVFLCSVFPSPDVQNVPNLKSNIQDLNLRLQMLNSTSATYVDYSSALMDPSSYRMRSVYTNDNVHLKAAGYQVIENVISSVLQPYYGCELKGGVRRSFSVMYNSFSFIDAVNALYYSLNYLDTKLPIYTTIQKCADLDDDGAVTFVDFVNLLYLSTA